MGLLYRENFTQSALQSLKAALEGRGWYPFFAQGKRLKTAWSVKKETKSELKLTI